MLLHFRLQYFTRILLAVFAICLFFQNHLWTQSIGRIERVWGNAFIERKGVAPIRIKKGLDVLLNDAIDAKKEAFVVINFNDGSSIEVAEETKLVIDEFIYEPEKKERSSSVSLETGKARFLVKDMPGYTRRAFDAKTPTAVIGIRGTDHITWFEREEEILYYTCRIHPSVKVSPEDYIRGKETCPECGSKLIPVYKGETSVLCLKGVVNVVNPMFPDVISVLTPRMYTSVSVANPPEPPKPINLPDYKEFTKGYEKSSTPPPPTPPTTTTTVPTTTVATTTEEETTTVPTTEAPETTEDCDSDSGGRFSAIAGDAHRRKIRVKV